MMMKRMLSLLMALLMAFSVTHVLADDWLTDDDEPDAVDVVTEDAIYDAASSVGTVVNTDAPQEPTDAEMIVYSYTPVEVVLVLDVSGSMYSADESGKSMINYAADAARTFAETLYTINPASRVGLVLFDDYGRVSCGMTGYGDQQELFDAIATINGGGVTNTGDGLLQAYDLLTSAAMPDRRKVVLMMADGVTNEGVGDPASYAINQGESCAALGNVFTIGLVGALDSGSKKECRRVLNAGYETKYFEVDSQDVGDTGAGLNQIMHLVAGAVSGAEAIDPQTGETVACNVYSMTLEDGFEGRVQGMNGEYLSNVAGDYSNAASFGTMSQSGDTTTFVFAEGNYDVDVQGVKNTNNTATLTAVSGLEMREKKLYRHTGGSHRSIHHQISLRGGEAEVVTLGYDVLDVTAIDENGQPTRGLDEVATGTIYGGVDVRPAPESRATALVSLAGNGRVQVLARDVESDWYLIAYALSETVGRGWIPGTALRDISGFVPKMIWLDVPLKMATSTTARLAPDAAAAEGYAISQGTEITLLHVERDDAGNEWAYVGLPSTQGGRYTYVPAESIQDWTTVAPDGFRIGYASPMFVEELSFDHMFLQGGQLFKVYTGPANNTYRGANGKAEVSTNGGMHIAGYVNNRWLLIYYGNNSGNTRAGYINVEKLLGEAPKVPVLFFKQQTVTMNEPCYLTDDIKNSSEQIVRLKTGTKVTYLCSFDTGDALWAYVQVKSSGQVARGFVPYEHIDFHE